MKKKRTSLKKHCIHCGAILKKGFTTYERGVCNLCTNTLPEYEEIRKEARAKRYKRYYLKNIEKEKERSKLNERKKRERLKTVTNE